MAYILRWKNPDALGPYADSKSEITVPAGTVVSDKSTLTFTGKGAANYGTIQQENLMRLLENSADSVPPANPTIGETWYDTTQRTLRLCTEIIEGTATWKLLGGIQVTNVGQPPPPSAALGDMWFERTGPLSGFLYVYSGIGRFPVGPTLGGWEQVWPTVETIAGREEYEAIWEIVSQLINAADGGSGVLGKSITNLTDFSALDAELRSKVAATPDSTIFSGDDQSELKVAAISNDWDTLLAAARHAVTRLDLPNGVLEDISSLPFVLDGRPPAPSLTSLSPSDARYPSAARRANRRFGSVTLHRAFIETVNVLTAALQNRYSLKGIGGASGANSTFGTNVTQVPHKTFSGAMGGATSATLGVSFNFGTSEALQSFLNGGSAIHIRMSLSPQNAGGNAVRDLFDQHGTVRITADKVRTFSNSGLTASLAHIQTGFKDVDSNSTNVSSQTLNGASYSILISNSGTSIGVTININGPSPVEGTLSIAFDIIRDTSTYGPSGAPIYSPPQAYQAGHKLAGSSAFLT